MRREGGIRELTSVVQKRFEFPENAVELYSEKVSNMASVPLRRLSLFVTSSLEALPFAGIFNSYDWLLIWWSTYAVVCCPPARFALLWTLLFCSPSHLYSELGYFKMSISCLRVTIFVNAINFLWSKDCNCCSLHWTSDGRCQLLMTNHYWVSLCRLGKQFPGMCTHVASIFYINIIQCIVMMFFLE